MSHGAGSRVVAHYIISQTETGVIIYAFISLCLDYFNSLFTYLGKNSIDGLQAVQNAATRLTRSSLFSHVIPLLSQLL